MASMSSSCRTGLRPPASAAIIWLLAAGSCGGVSLAGLNLGDMSRAAEKADLARAQSQSGAPARGARRSVRQPVADAVLDGGGEPWNLFAPGSVPREPPGDERMEVLVPPDPLDPIGIVCAPNDELGYWYYNVSFPLLVPFILAEGHPRRTDAAVIVAPGGGFSFLAWNKEGTRIAKWLNFLGISAFVLKYRVPTNPYDDESHAKCLGDAQRAVSLVRHRAPKFGLNTSRVGVMGFSAGGMLAASVSYTRDRVYGPLDEVDANGHQPDFALLIYGKGKPSEAQYAPPTFIAISSDDQCVSSQDAKDYHTALQQHRKVGDELHVFAEGRHGYGDCTMYVEGGDWRDVCAWTLNAWLFLDSQVLGVHPPLNFSGAMG